MITSLRCLGCGQPLPDQKGAGRPRQFCGKPCKDLRNDIQRLERSIEAVAPLLNARRRADLRSEIWRLLNDALNERK